MNTIIHALLAVVFCVAGTLLIAVIGVFILTSKLVDQLEELNDENFNG